MNKSNKISIILLSAIVLCLSFPSINGAVNLTDSIDVEVEQWIGLVKPAINIDNQSVIINADLGVNNTYDVDDTINIDINITDKTNRTSFILPRTMFYSILIVRKAEITWGFDLFSRMFPVHVVNSTNVVDSMIGAETSSSITIPLKYTISNTTYDDGEEMTMYIMVMGLLPGDTNGGPFGLLPIIDFKRITLNATYV